MAAWLERSGNATVHLIAADQPGSVLGDAGVRLARLKRTLRTPDMLRAAYRDWAEELWTDFGCLWNDVLISGTAEKAVGEIKAQLDGLSCEVLLGMKGLLSQLLCVTNPQWSAHRAPQICNFVSNPGLLQFMIHRPQQAITHLTPFPRWALDVRTALGPYADVRLLSFDQLVASRRKALAPTCSPDAVPTLLIYANNESDGWLDLLRTMLSMRIRVQIFFIAVRDEQLAERARQLANARPDVRVLTWLTEREADAVLSKAELSDRSVAVTKCGPGTLLFLSQYRLSIVAVDSGLPPEDWVLRSLTSCDGRSTVATPLDAAPVVRSLLDKVAAAPIRIPSLLGLKSDDNLGVPTWRYP
ncbi:hypothetical protein [Novosphingobium sp. BL-52-GroH]|uniref:hypothetical protein n=1 Tax=Novosphingobium sp. BL-52-GroH TaxID=3349877 RepID=UPI003850467C